MEAFSAGFGQLANSTTTPQQWQSIVDYYNTEFKPAEQQQTGETVDVSRLLPTSNAQKYLQANYTAPFADPEKAIRVDDARDGSAWSAANARFNDYFREIVQRFQFEDALLLDAVGNVVYTAYKGIDLGTNILTGPYRQSCCATPTTRPWRRTPSTTSGSPISATTSPPTSRPPG